MKQAISLLRAVEIIRSGRFCKVIFVKRSTGEIRDMFCRSGVKKHLRGGDAAYNFGERNLISVYDLHKKDYRSIPVDGILYVNDMPVDKNIAIH
jgi:hypothetical protein